MPLRLSAVARITWTCFTPPSVPMMILTGMGVTAEPTIAGSTFHSRFSPTAWFLTHVETGEAPSLPRQRTDYRG